jgi:hypothetical protein
MDGLLKGIHMFKIMNYVTLRFYKRHDHRYINSTWNLKFEYLILKRSG